MITTNVDNLVLATDSYKLNHWNQYPKDAEAVYSYFESRSGARFPYTVFFGLQYIIKHYLIGQAVTWDDISEANRLATKHFSANPFNYQGWSHIMQAHGGRLPLRIKAVPEGTPVPTGNVLMTVENTDPACYWLTNAIESLLTHVWYPSTVATLSHHTLEMIRGYLGRTADSDEGWGFKLHDFGYRGASSHESAALGGAAHLVNALGTDTLPGMLLAQEYYGADLDTLAFSVPATEHSVMTAMGEEGEHHVIEQLLDEYPTGILSVVGDSYDIYRFTGWLGSDFKERILARDGVFVARPDSVTGWHKTPERLVIWIMDRLWQDFGGTINAKGFKVIDPHVRVLWGDGIDPTGIKAILEEMARCRYGAENIATFGMGGGLLQKVNRDTQRFAFKASAIKRDGEWHDVFKKTPDKTSKRGRLALRCDDGQHWVTASEKDTVPNADHLQTVFEDGKLIKEYTFDEVRANARNQTLAVA